MSPQNFSVVATLLAIVIVAAIFLPLSIARALAYDAGNNDDVRSTSGNYVINYVYEIEVEKPELLVDKPKVAQGGSITIKGANFANSTVSIQAFDEKLLIFKENGDEQNQTSGLLLARSDIALAQPAVGKAAVMKKFAHDDNLGQASNGTVTLVVKIPSDGTQDYYADLQCKSAPGSPMHEDPAIISLGSGTVNGSSRQFVNASIPVGDYQNCEIVVTLPETGKMFRSEPLDFTVVPDVHAKPDGKAVVVATNGSFRMRVSLHDSIQPGKYVFMAEEQLEDDDAKHQPAMAIVPIHVLAKQYKSTTTTHTSIESLQESFVESSVQSSSRSTTSTDTTSSNDVPSDHQEPDDNNNNDNNGSGGEEQPPTTPPPDDGPKEVCTTDDSSFESSNGASYTNTISQTSIQTANNAIINDDVITITQRIIGATNASQNVVMNVDVSNDNEVTQSVRQNIVQKAEIEHCHIMGGGSDAFESKGVGATNATNLALSAALQEAYNIYSDSDVIQIQQTIIIPKYCSANVYAPITMDDRNRISQSIDQDIVQKSKIKFTTDGSASGQGSTADNAAQYLYLQKNYVTQLSIQGASNIGLDNNVININQAIIVPASCDADVYAPIVIGSSSDIQLSITQKAEQVSTIQLAGQQSGITIANAISTGNSSQSEGGSVFTNTIINHAEQYGENLFIDNDNLQVVQQVFYVNDTTGWTPDNYQDKLAEEFGGSDGNSTGLTPTGNQTSDTPLEPADDTGNNNDTALAEETETADNTSSNDTASADISDPIATTSNMTTILQQSGLQDASNYNQDNSTINVSQDAEGYQVDTGASVHDTNDDEQANGQVQEQDGAIASDGDDMPAGDGNSTSTVENGIEQTGVQLATNYNEENGETTVDQGALGNQVNAGIEVADENNLAQSDGQDQSQEATITTGGNSTST